MLDKRLSRFLWGHLKHYRKLVLLSLCFMLLVAFSRMAPPYILKIAIDRYISHRDFSGLSLMALFYLLFVLLEYGAIYVQIYATQLFGQNVVKDMRLAIFSHVLRLPVPYFDKTPHGKTLNYMTSDMENINEFVTSGIVTTAGDVLTILGIAAVMMYLSLPLTAVAALFFFSLFLATHFLRKRFHEAYRATRESASEMNAFLNESLAGIYVSKLFCRKEAEISKFQEKNERYVAAYKKVIHYLSLYFPLVESVGTLTILAILVASDAVLVYGAITFGTIVAFIEYSQKIYNPIRDLSEKYNLYQNALSSLEKIDALLSTEVERQVEDSPEISGDIEFKDVWLSYDDESFALKGINLTIGAGEKVGVVGLTGSGKTSLINLLLGFYRPSRGEIRIGGRGIEEYSPDVLRKAFGIVSQDVYVFPRTLEENLLLGDNHSLPEELAPIAGGLFGRGLEKVVSEDGINFSEGEKQVISLGRLMTCRPSYIILDEATSKIDTCLERGISNILEGQFYSCTWIIIAHTLHSIQKLNRIIVIHEGQLVEEGSHEELLQRNGLYGHLFGITLERREYENLHREAWGNGMEPGGDLPR